MEEALTCPKGSLAYMHIEFEHVIPEQLCPHSPQWSESELVFTHLSVQIVFPTWQTQLPASQSNPGPHLFSQPPQLFLSEL